MIKIKTSLFLFSSLLSYFRYVLYVAVQQKSTYMYICVHTHTGQWNYSIE